MHPGGITDRPGRGVADMEEILLTFEGASVAARAERLLLGAGFSVRVMPVPGAIRAGCGIALRLPPDESEAALGLLDALEIKHEGRYLRKIEGAKSRYIGLGEARDA